MPIFDDYGGLLPPDQNDMNSDNDVRQRRPKHRLRGGRLRSSDQRAGATSDISHLTVASQTSPQTPTISRGDLIQRIKRGQSPSLSPEVEQKPFPGAPSRDSDFPLRHNDHSQSLLPAAEFKEHGVETLGQDLNLSSPADIERPRSALHSGDFREREEEEKERRRERLQKERCQPAIDTEPLSTSPIAPWHRDFPEAALNSFRFRQKLDYDERADNEFPRPERPPLSTSISSSSFVLLPPTSPLVQQSNTTDLERSPRASPLPASRSPERSNRRHTFSPRSLQTFRTSFESSPLSSSPGRRLPNLRRDGTFPYQAHQPRRSLSSALGSASVSVPQTPSMRPRRPSLSGDSTPLSRAPLVGSYEESILRGRMSTTPSRPLDFVAKIGVLGKGKCKPSLRCPKHVSIPFPAVFYSYSPGSGGMPTDQPSPYVGCIDMDSLASSQKNRRHRTDHTAPEGSGEDTLDIDQMDLDDTHPRTKRRSHESKAPPGGSYRIPQIGQIQVVIQNPNKTAVKLFLIPYDLTGMQPGQKTFIRQRAYSAGPLFPTLPVPHGPATLRYLIHLQICCTGKGRFYLYNSIRVVFANRVPDGKERLTNETKFPEPRFSTYKPSHQHSSSLSVTGSLQSDMWRRRSEGLVQPAFNGFPPADMIDGLSGSPIENSPTIAMSTPKIVKPIPFSFTRLEPVLSRPTSRDDRMDIDGPGEPDGNSSQAMDVGLGEPGPTLGECDFSPITSRQTSPAYPGAGLLARKLRGLDVDESASNGQSEMFKKDSS